MKSISSYIKNTAFLWSDVTATTDFLHSKYMATIQEASILSITQSPIICYKLQKLFCIDSDFYQSSIIKKETKMILI